MKEINELLAIFKSSVQFRGAYQWNELKVKKEFNDKELKTILDE